MTYFNIDGFEIDVILPTSILDCDLRIIKLKAKAKTLIHERKDLDLIKATDVELAIIEAWRDTVTAQLADMISKSRFNRDRLDTEEGIIEALHSILSRAIAEEELNLGNDEKAILAASRAYLMEKAAVSISPQNIASVANNIYKKPDSIKKITGLQLIEIKTTATNGNGNGNRNGKSPDVKSDLKDVRSQINILQNTIKNLTSRIEKEKQTRIKVVDKSERDIKMVFRSLHALVLNLQNPESESAKSELKLMMSQLDFVTQIITQYEDWGIREFRTMSDEDLSDEDLSAE